MAEGRDKHCDCGWTGNTNLDVCPECGRELEDD